MLDQSTPNSGTRSPGDSARVRTLSDLIVARRRLVVGATVVGLVLLIVVRGLFGANLSTGGFQDPSTESSRAADALLERFGRDEPGVVLVATAGDGSVDSDASRADGVALTERLAAQPDVVQVTSYWATGLEGLRSAEGDRALVLARIDLAEDQASGRATEIVEEFTGTSGSLDVALTGEQVIGADVGDRIGRDLLRAELVALPIALLLLIAFFRRVLVGLLPLVIGGLTVVASIAALGLLAALTDVSIFATNLVIALGLGLSIDYALLLIARYREEKANGHDGPAAMVATLRTSGRTIVFSAITVAVALAALIVYPLGFLRSMAYAGIAAALIGAAVTLLVLPAVLVALGDRVPPAAPAADGGRLGAWGRIATVVMRRPLLVAGVVVAGLIVLLLPVRDLQPGFPDDRNLPESAPSRIAAEVIRTEFAGRDSAPTDIVLTHNDDDLTDADISTYAVELSRIDGVTRVDTPTGSYADGEQIAPAGPANAALAVDGATAISVISSAEPYSEAGAAFVEQVRATPAPAAALVGGQAATLVDTTDSLYAATPWALAIIAVVTFVALFLMFGSLLVPLKALALNLLSLTAMFGAMVWIFQDGNLSDLLGFTATGTITAAFPVLMFCVAFGLSMDYEVFLLARIKEEHDLHGDNDRAVIVGLDRTGRIVTFAALLIGVVFAGIATSSVANIKLFGTGLLLAVLMDAFVIRGLLIPAFMKLAGEANWWAPRPLRRIYDRYGISH